MKLKQLTLLTNDDNTDNPTYRVLVQTPGPLEYPELDGIQIDYKEEAIREAMPGLIGHDVIDELTEHERSLGITPKAFATITDTGYCPEYGGYADIEVWHPDYKPVFENMHRNLEKGIVSKRKFSTELQPTQLTETEQDKYYDLDGFSYDGMVMTTNPRDTQTGLCRVMLNTNKIKEVTEATIMAEDKTEMKEITIDEYQTLVGVQTQHEELQAKYEEGKKMYDSLKPEDFEEYQELAKEKDDLYQQLLPVWTQQGQIREELVNSLVEKLPEDEQETAREKFTTMDTDTLTILQNSLKDVAPEPKGAVPTGTEQKEEEEDELTVEEAMKQLGYK